MLIVKVPVGEGREPLAQVRAHVMEAMPSGVLVLEQGTELEFLEDLPELQAEVRQKQPGPVSGRAAREKKAILERLKNYREIHGLGCLAAIAKAGGRETPEPMLRDMLTGEGVYTVDQWRAVDRAITAAQKGDRR